jgi:hypothetical protein
MLALGDGNENAKLIQSHAKLSSERCRLLLLISDQSFCVIIQNTNRYWKYRVSTRSFGLIERSVAPEFNWSGEQNGQQHQRSISRPEA